MSISKKFQSAKKNYKVTFSLPLDVAPNAKSVQVIGEFNNWDVRTAPAMKSSKKEYSATLELNPGSYQFRYLIDGLRWENDFAADNYVSSPFAGINNSVLVLAGTATSSGSKRGRKPSAEKAVKPAKTTGAKRGRKPKSESATAAAVTTPKTTSGAKRGRKPNAEKAATSAPKAATETKRGRKPSAVKSVTAAPKVSTGAKRGRKPKAEGTIAAPKPASTGKRGRPKKSA